MSDTSTKPFADARRAPDGPSEIQLNGARFWMFAGLILMLADALACFGLGSLAFRDVGILLSFGPFCVGVWAVLSYGVKHRKAWSAYWFCLFYIANCIVNLLVACFLVMQQFGLDGSRVSEYGPRQRNYLFFFVLPLLGIKIGVLTVGLTAALKIRTTKLLTHWRQTES